MKKMLLLFCTNFCTIALFAQRYTGYGRGMDLGDNYFFSKFWNKGTDLFIFAIFIIIILGGLLHLRDKIRHYWWPYKKGYIPFRRLKNRFERPNNFALVNIIRNDTGEWNRLCMFTSLWGRKTFLAFSPYLGECSMKELTVNEKDFFIQVYGNSKSYFVCTVESDKYREKNLDTWPYFREEYELEQLLK